MRSAKGAPHFSTVSGYCKLIIILITDICISTIILQDRKALYMKQVQEDAAAASVNVAGTQPEKPVLKVCNVCYFTSYFSQRQNAQLTRNKSTLKLS